MKVGLELSPVMVLILFLSFLGLSFFTGIMYKDEQNLKQNSKKAWVLSMTAGVGIVGWMFLYGYYVNSL